MSNSERLISSRFFIAIDCLLVGFALIVALCWADQLTLPLNLHAFLSVRVTVKNLLRAGSVFLLWAILMRLFRMYSSSQSSLISEALRIAVAVAATSFVLAESFDQHHKGAAASQIAVDFAVFCFVALSGIRALVSLLAASSHPGVLGRRNVVIVGTGPRAIRAYRHVRTQLFHTHWLLGFVDCRATSLTPGEVESLYLGPLSNLQSILLHQPIDEVVIALPARSCYAEIEQTVAICSTVGVKVRYPDDMLPAAAPPRNNTARLIAKRLLDIFAATLALVVLSPLMLLKLGAQGLVFSSEERLGQGRRTFRLLKFRRGPFENLPQLINILLGHMSLVGPTPLTREEVSRFDQPSLMRRFNVKPGLTCLPHDAHYIDNWSLRLDAKILAQTILEK